MDKPIAFIINYPPEYDEVTVCESCGDEFNSKIESPDHPYEPLINNCCSWECLSILHKDNLVFVQSRERDARRQLFVAERERDEAIALLSDIRQILDRIEDIETAQCVEMIDVAKKERDDAGP